MESSSKRARAPANMSQVAHCLVDGCNADLSLCRDYHRRHKVCETHSKTSKVTIAGREQRFCQQCSRFHSLVEFDEGKRSCRKRLDGHNRRRRKPQPDRNSALDFSNHHHSTLTGTTTTTSLLSFTNNSNNNSPQILPSSVVGFSWPGNIKTETETSVLYNNTNHHQMNYNNYKGAASANHHHQLEFSSSDGLNHNRHHNHHHNHNHDHHRHGREIVGPDGALSLLSSNQSTREMGLVQNEQVLSSGLVHNYGVLGQQYHHNHHHNHHDELAAQEINKTVVVDSSHGRNNASTLHFADMFQQGQDGSSTSGPHQTLTFMWE